MADDHKKTIKTRVLPFLLLLLTALALFGCGQRTKDGSAKENDGEKVCYLSVSCATALENIDKLPKEKRELLPADGMLYAEKAVPFSEGDSVFDVLRKSMRENGIHLEFSGSGAFGNVYIEGIGNLYEFDCGELSGWMFRLDGETPTKGCSEIFPKDGSRIEWVYTCNLGRDVGTFSLAEQLLFDGSER